MPHKREARIKICWPKPDEVCLQGGCSYCRESNFVELPAVREYARERGPKFVAGLNYAEERGFPNQSYRKASR
jgi:hypothetical protein